MIYSQLCRLREAIISYTGDTFTGKGDPFSKNVIKHRIFMNDAYSRGPDLVAVIFLRAEKYFDFRGPASGVYNRYCDEASEEIAINCIKIMENYISW